MSSSALFCPIWYFFLKYVSTKILWIIKQSDYSLLFPLFLLGISDLEHLKMKWPTINWGDTMKTESVLDFKDILWAISLCSVKQEIIGWVNMKLLRCSDFSHSSDWCWKKSNCLIVKTILLNKAAFQKTVSVLWCYSSEHVLVLLLVMMIKNIVFH